MFNSKDILFQLCSSASIATTDSVSQISPNTTTKTNPQLAELFDRVKAVPGVNIQWVDEFSTSFTQFDPQQPYGIAVERAVYILK